AGDGFEEGLLTSDSTRTRGLVTTTDIAPTILERYGVAVPDEMNGEEIRASGTEGVAEVVELRDRFEVTNLRRGPAIGQNVLAWIVLTALACLAFGRRGARVALALLAVAGAYLPLMCLLTAA